MGTPRTIGKDEGGGKVLFSRKGLWGKLRGVLASQLCSRKTTKGN